MHHLLGSTDVVIRLNSRSYFLDDAIPGFGDSYHHCPWRAVNDAYHKPSNVAWQIFKVSPITGGAWRLVPVLVATRAISEGEELLRDYYNISYRSSLPVLLEPRDELGAGDQAWVYTSTTCTFVS
jgi:hypothetical protein